MVTKGKPDPQVFQIVAEGMGVPIVECLIFEDSPTGVETALRAGCQVVVVTTTHSQEEFARFPNVLRFIDDYRHLDDLL
jgi:beta-phosphoglucomutase-like phosphatase (HAD superfamily)